jgi:hypothetical protein
MPLIPALRRLRQEGHEFKASPGYLERTSHKTKLKYKSVKSTVCLFVLVVLEIKPKALATLSH